MNVFQEKSPNVTVIFTCLFSHSHVLKWAEASRLITRKLQAHHFDCWRIRNVFRLSDGQTMFPYQQLTKAMTRKSPSSITVGHADVAHSRNYLYEYNCPTVQTRNLRRSVRWLLRMTMNWARKAMEKTKRVDEAPTPRNAGRRLQWTTFSSQKEWFRFVLGHHMLERFALKNNAGSTGLHQLGKGY